MRKTQTAPGKLTLIRMPYPGQWIIRIEQTGQDKWIQIGAGSGDLAQLARVFLAEIGRDWPIQVCGPVTRGGHGWTESTKAKRRPKEREK